MENQKKEFKELTIEQVKKDNPGMDEVQAKDFIENIIKIKN